MGISNEYARTVSFDAPKEVWKAIATSLATCGGDRLDEGSGRLAWEWQCLHQAGIVPQRPPVAVRALADQFQRG